MTNPKYEPGRDYKCPTCGAEPGAPCVAVQYSKMPIAEKGRPIAMVHKARQQMYWGAQS